jgi:dihydroorotase
MPDVVGRAIVMPNLKPPVTTTELALEYLGRITAALPEGSTFQAFVNKFQNSDHFARPRVFAPS